MDRISTAFIYFLTELAMNPPDPAYNGNSHMSHQKKDKSDRTFESQIIKPLLKIILLTRSSRAVPQAIYTWYLTGGSGTFGRVIKCYITH